MEDEREQEEKAGQHGGEGEQCAAMVTSKPFLSSFGRLEEHGHGDGGEAGSDRYVMHLHKYMHA